VENKKTDSYHIQVKYRVFGGK